MKSFNPRQVPQTSPLAQQISNKSFTKSSIASNSTATPKTTYLLPNNFETNDPTLNSKYASTQQTSISLENSSKIPKKSLVIDVNNESQSYNILNNTRIAPYSTTNNPSGGSSQFFKGPGGISSSGTQSVRNSKLDSKFESPFNNSNSTSSKKNGGSPKVGIFTGNFPRSNMNVGSNRIGSASATGSLDAFLSQLSPKNLHHLRSASTKSGSYGIQKLSNKSSETSSIDSQNISSQENIEHHNPIHTRKASSEKDNKENSTSFEPMVSKTNVNSVQVPAQKVIIPNHEPTKCSVKRNGIVKAYAANTNQGIVRNYNEDRVSIILNIMKPASRMNEEWPKCSFFGVYDGHGGVNCADFLRDNLHQYVIREPSFPWDPKEAIIKGFEAAEQAFLTAAENRPNGELDKSGSCAIIALIVGDMCYAANVGDSRAVMSGEGGNKIYNLSRDHKPSEENEQRRIIEGGGKIYQTQAPIFRPTNEGIGSKGETQFLLGPHRVFPGRLSVSRTFGDIEAKLVKYGGNPNAVIATPEIKVFKISDNHDFIVLACDGIYDKLSSRDVVKCVWESTREKASDIHQQCGLGVEEIMRESLNRRTLDNITVLMICFKNFKNKVFPPSIEELASSDSLNKRNEISAHQSAQIIRPSTSGTGPKQDYKALRERVNNQRTTNEASYSNGNISGTTKSYSFLKENSSNISGSQFEGTRTDKGSVLAGKELNKKVVKSRNALAENDENQSNDAYFNYLQHGEISKMKSNDYKNSDFLKHNVHAEKKI